MGQTQNKVSKKNLGEQKAQHYFHSCNINHFRIGYAELMLKYRFVVVPTD
ncbi:hypothetical protein LEP1GSC026_0610 [Leptospira interrogans str. 2002000623]|nr:hypothetical protein LEP1GSC026_0610 [Leptospira interrogans str. 2002000623]